MKGWTLCVLVVANMATESANYPRKFNLEIHPNASGRIAAIARKRQEKADDRGCKSVWPLDAYSTSVSTNTK